MDVEVAAAAAEGGVAAEGEEEAPWAVAADAVVSRSMPLRCSMPNRFESRFHMLTYPSFLVPHLGKYLGLVGRQVLAVVVVAVALDVVVEAAGEDSKQRARSEFGRETITMNNRNGGSRLSNCLISM